MLLLALELLSNALCAGSAESELGALDTINGVNVAKQYGAVRVSAARWAMLVCGVWPALTLSCRRPAVHLLRTSRLVDARRSWRSRCVGYMGRTGSGRWLVSSSVRGHEE